MTNNKVLVDQNGKESVYCNRLDGLGIEILKKNKIETIVVSREKNPVVTKRCQKLKIRCFQGIKNKEGFITALLKKLGYKWKQIAYVGDSISDLGCVKKAGIGIVVLDAEKEVKEAADYILWSKGGQGAIKEVSKLWDSRK